MKIKLKRDVFSDTFTLGSLFVNWNLIGFTCEDADRKLEEGGGKIYGKTAIPRGMYKVTLSFSHRFQKVMPEILSVPGYTGVRIHGGNTHEDTLGCPLLGSVRTQTGVAKCKEVNQRLINMIEAAEELGESVELEVV
jgi:hypothetical protein